MGWRLGRGLDRGLGQMSRKSDHKMETIQYTCGAPRRIVGRGDIPIPSPTHDSLNR
ncbi:hypothetical protein BN2475_1390027 [Paraburkholderia ribeironis]|uniref:Uncharacterized protein n=1 Tax=Paraburkholderia ribeironis TaxID=1247936 RepID=A0A1N7SPU4_9BURK|nr:hypothetical protein BN2475_1390027 [Paraburkholderia ribeironis]